MKKYLFGALALPLLFACSSEDFDEKVVSNDQFAGIAKVDATFSMDGAFTRFDGGVWNTEEDDVWGFAWMGGVGGVGIDGKAYQNHNLIQTNGIFTPQTSIYVGKYYIYRPYDKTTVSPQAIKFKSLEEQPLAEGFESEKKPWKNLAKTAINIGDKWTDVTTGGWTDASGKKWDKAGIKQNYKIYAAMFSNQTCLELTYTNNNVAFDGKSIAGATDINYTYPAGSTIGAADIYSGTVLLADAPKSFTYAPTASPNGTSHNGNFWETKQISGVGGFAGTAGAITLKSPDANKDGILDGVSTGEEGCTQWFWFNSLPATTPAGSAATVTTTLNTSYGDIVVAPTLAACAWALEDPTGTPIGQKTPVKWTPEWIKLAAADALPTASTPREWDPSLHTTFINELGNHKGKYVIAIDFKNSDMSKMHIVDDNHLQKALKFYIASGKTEAVVLNLDKDADNEFKISKISIALIQTIQNAGHNVKVKACALDAAHTPGKIVVTQDGQAALGLAAATDVPNLNNVFAAATDVYLSKNYTWTWSDKIKTGTTAGELTIDANVNSITNEGTLNVTAQNIQLSIATVAGPPAQYTLANAADATMNITKVTTVKNALTNLGTINVGAADNTAAELRAYNATITNDATTLTAYGTINNYGVVGKSAGTTGQVDNYGHINMENDGAITLLHSNELNGNIAPDGPFKTTFVAGTNMMGTVVLPEGNPYALVSVSNTDETGFIKYNWTASTYSHDDGNVKYNTIVVSNNIEFTGWTTCDEIKFIEFNGTRSQVVNPATFNFLNKLKGVIVNPGKSFILEKTNVLDCYDGAFLGAGATIYRGGAFLYQGANFKAAQTTNYLGTWSLDQIVEW